MAKPNDGIPKKIEIFCSDPLVCKLEKDMKKIKINETVFRLYLSMSITLHEMLRQYPYYN